MHYMSVEQLQKLHKGDKVFVDGKYHTVKSKGRRYVYLERMNQPIELRTGMLKSTGFGTGDTHPIFSCEETYNRYMEDKDVVMEAYTMMRNFTYSNTLTPSMARDILTLLRNHTNPQAAI